MFRGVLGVNGASTVRNKDDKWKLFVVSEIQITEKEKRNEGSAGRSTVSSGLCRRGSWGSQRC